MVHSLLLPKSSLIIKPSSAKEISDIGYYAFRQIHHRLADQAYFQFYYDLNSQVENELIEAFLAYGLQKQGRQYTYYSDQKDLLFLYNIVGSEEDYRKSFQTDLNTDEEVFFSNMTRVLFSPLNYKSPPNRHSQQYFFYVLRVDNEITNFKCNDFEKAFQLETRDDFYCFAKNLEPKFQKEKSNNPIRFAYAFERIKPGYFVFYIREY